MVGRDRQARRSVRIVYAVVQFSAPQCVEKCCVVFELVSKRVPNDPRFSVTLRQFRNQNVKRVIDSAANISSSNSLLPRGGMGADRVTEALERNLAEVFELEAFAEA